MTRQEKWRLFGTAVLAVATAVTYTAGLLAGWYYLYGKLPFVLKILATAGCAISPFALVKDLLDEQKTAINKQREKTLENEALD